MTDENRPMSRRLRRLVVPCPFCGGMAQEHPNRDWRWKFVAVHHTPDCWFATKAAIKGGYNLTPVAKRGNARKAWDRRHNAQHHAEATKEPIA